MRHGHHPPTPLFRGRQIIWSFILFLLVWVAINWQWVQQYQIPLASAHSEHSHDDFSQQQQQQQMVLLQRQREQQLEAFAGQVRSAAATSSTQIAPVVQFHAVDQSKRANCGHWYGRNYYQHPIWSAVDNVPDGLTKQCDVPCIWSTDTKGAKYVDIVKKEQRKRCEHVVGRELSMEAVYEVGGESSTGRPERMIVSYTDLDSDVPVPYFSWSEYGFMERLTWPKPARSMAAAWISNCQADNGRLDYLAALMRAGVTVDSYGSCLRNQPNPQGKRDWFKTKIDTLRQYKFAIAFENTNLKDYVTEKLWMAFVAGAVPIHMGVPDVHRFGPSNHSIISVHDFASPQDLAAHLLWLDRHPDEYARYLDWKWKGYSPHFQALVDLTAVHTSCRTCIEAADRLRTLVGEPHPSVRPFLEDARQTRPQPTSRSNGNNLGDTNDDHGQEEYWVRIRERNKFWFRRLWLPGSPSALSRALLFDRASLLLVQPRLTEQPTLYLYGIQTVARPHVLLDSDELVRQHVRPAVELEAILLVAPDFSQLTDLYPPGYLPNV